MMEKANKQIVDILRDIGMFQIIQWESLFTPENEHYLALEGEA